MRSIKRNASHIAAPADSDSDYAVAANAGSVGVQQ
jgi:hypothetical protein